MTRNADYIHLLLEETSQSSNHFKNSLEYINETQLFNKISEKNNLTDILASINAKLHSAGDSRGKALLLLERFLPQCPSNVFSDYSAGWIQQCCKWNQRTINEEFRILNELVKKSRFNPDLKKQISINVLPRFAEQLVPVEDQKSMQFVILKLRCMKSLIDCYSSSCGPYKGTFQKYVIYCLKEFQDHNSIVQKAAECFVALCECGTKGQQGINFKEAWSSQFKLLINTCHKLFDVIYSNVNVIELMSIERSENILPGFLDVLFDVSETPIKRYHTLKHKFFVITELLRAMLLCKFSVYKSFQPNDIFNLICRLLSVNYTVLEQCVQTNDIIALTSNIPELHKCTFDILDAVITCASRNLVPYGSLICKLCLQSLKWTNASEWTYGSSKPFESLRSKVFAVLSLWLSTVSFCSSVEIFADDLVPLIISDIEFTKPSVKLTVTTTAKNKKNKHKRGQTVTEVNMQSDSTIMIDNFANKNVCAVAHRTLQLLLRCASTLIKWEHHKIIQYTVLHILLETVDSLSVNQYPVPYSDVNCRYELFRTLFALVSEPHPKWIAPLSLALRLTVIGSYDSNVKIASFCKTALTQLELMIHPRCATLYFANECKEKTSLFKNSNWFTSAVPSSLNALSYGNRNSDEKTIADNELLISCPPSMQETLTEMDFKRTSESNSHSTGLISVEMNDVQMEIHESSKDTSEISTSLAIVMLQGEKSNALSPKNLSSEELQGKLIAGDNETNLTTLEVHQISSPMPPDMTVLDNEEPPIKKSKTLAVKTPNEQLELMLNDFVDTLE